MKTLLKKLTVIAAALVLAIGTVACSGGSEEDTATENNDNKVLIGFDNTFVPMGFLDEDENIVGFDIDLAKEVFSRLDKEVEFQTIDWSMKETELNNGNVDALWNGYSLSPEREKVVSYTDSYLQNKQIIVTMADSGVNSKADLAGKEVGTQRESTAQAAIEKDTEFMGTLKDGRPVLYDTYDKALRDLEIGRTSAVAGDEVLIRYYIGQKGEDKYKVLEENFGLEDYVVAFAKENTELRDQVNDTLNEMKEDGTFDEIYNKWFK